MNHVSALLLAAGRSSRMGRLKGLLPWQGKPLIEWQITQLRQSVIDDLIVVLGYQAEQYEPYLQAFEITTVLNTDCNRGKCSSILKGLQSVTPHTDAILIAAVDQPMRGETVNRMIRFMEQSDKGIVIPVYRGKRGHPVLFSATLREELLQINEETQGLKNVLRTQSEKIAELHIDDSYVLYNFNRPSDFLSACYEERKETNAYK
mgnify:FL=1